MGISLSEFIYNLHKENSFFDKKNSFRVMYGFSHNNFKDMIFKTFLKDGIISEPKENIICILGDFENFRNSLFFTNTALYIENSLTGQKGIKISYSSIKELKVQDVLNIILKTGEIYKLSNLWKAESIAKFLSYACNCNMIEDKFEEISAEKGKPNIDTISKSIYSNISISSANYGTTKFNGSQGHGFAAERANHIYDTLTGKKAMILGDDNALNGADRMVNGQSIQAKYCQTGSGCIAECFENGKFRYINADGTPMQIEVPSDMYENAVSSMKRRIENGEVPNVTNPEDAEKIVRKGHFTYEQAKNIAKAGTVESIAFDSINGAIIATSAFGMSSCLTFAVSVWNGENFDTALKNATYSGLKVGGTAFVTTVITSQITRMGAESLLVGGTESFVKILGPKATSTLANAFRSGKNIYGAAATRNVAKLLRGNIITAGVSVAVLSTVDIANIFRGRISGAQLFKNITNTTSAVAGGTAGWVGGSAVGAKLGATLGTFTVPGLGTVAGTAIGGAIGGIIGSFGGGAVAGKTSNKVLNNFIEDDVNKMLKIIEKEFTKLSTDYLLNRDEAENVIDNLKEDLTGSTLKDMFADDNKKEFARDLILPHIEHTVGNRKKIKLPTEKQICQELRIVLEEIADNTNN